MLMFTFLAEAPKRKSKIAPVGSNSTGSPVRTAESRQSTVVSQTLSASGKVRVEKDGLPHRIRTEKVPRLTASHPLFTPDKVRVKTEKMLTSGSPVRVKTEKTFTSHTLKSPDCNEFKARRRDRPPEKKPMVVSETISSEKVRNEVKLSIGEKPRKKVADQAKKRILESEDRDGDSDDDVPLTSLKCEQKSAGKEVELKLLAVFLDVEM